MKFFMFWEMRFSISIMTRGDSEEAALVIVKGQVQVVL